MRQSYSYIVAGVTIHLTMVLATYNVSRFLNLNRVLKFILFHVLLQAERLDKSATSSTVSISNEMLESQSKIFGLNNPLMLLTDYQKAVNQASLELCKNNIPLLKKCGELLEKARKKVDDEGYNYKKKSSRSTVFGSGSSNELRSKRKYEQSDCREEEMKKYLLLFNLMRRLFLSFKSKS